MLLLVLVENTQTSPQVQSSLVLSPEQIRYIRIRRLHITQGELARRLCVHRVTVANWERGKTQPIPSILAALRRIAGIEVSA